MHLHGRKLGYFLSLSMCLIHNVAGATGDCLWNPLGPLDTEKTVDPKCTLPVNDKSSLWDPWSHRPVCSHLQDGSEYCAYTRDVFHGPSGLGILATPQVAAELAGYLNDPDPAWLHKQVRLYYTRADSGVPAYTVRDIPGKGKGAIANRTIRAGEVLVRETPVFITLTQLPAGLEPSEMASLFQGAFVNLPPSDQDRLRAMAQSAPSGGHFLRDVLNTNGFAIKIGDHVLSAVCPDISRLNHACRPNAFGRFVATTMTMEAIAYRDIQAGEELTLSYLPLNLLSDDRKTMIQKWHFNCTCPVCSSPDRMKTSDSNKGRIQEILDELKDTSKRTPERVESLAQELMTLLETEGLQAQTGNFASILAGVYLGMFDLGKAREYGKLAAESQMYYLGFDNEKTTTALEMVEFLYSIELE